MASHGNSCFGYNICMLVTCYPFIARQPLYIDLPATGVEVVNLLGNIIDKVLARLVLV